MPLSTGDVITAVCVGTASVIASATVSPAATFVDVAPGRYVSRRACTFTSPPATR